jgi:hypothetical protein
MALLRQYQHNSIKIKDITIRLLNSRTVNVKFLTFFWSVPMVTYIFSCLYTKSSYKYANKKSLVMFIELIPFLANNN